MVKIDIVKEEVEALNELMNDAKVPIEMGYTLGILKRKIGEAFKKEIQDNQMKMAKQIVKEQQPPQPQKKPKQKEEAQEVNI